MVVYCIAFIILVGLRPVSYHFGDTVSYAHMYYGYQRGTTLCDPESSEWLFNGMMSRASHVMNVQYFFLIIEFFYIVPMLWACMRLVSKNGSIAMLFCLGAFSFFSYGVNGIRNGMACSLILLALSFVLGTKKEKIIAGVLCFCAYNIHHSTALPILCMIIAYVYRNTRMVMYFWLFSIVVSLVAGGIVENFFSGLGFDDRLNGYINSHQYDDSFSSTGFRWDFLLYSVMPIWLGWYVIFKKKIVSQNYQLLLNTYILCNAFWVMLIRSSFSNRFAYLSWFMYPLVLAYPLLTLPIWKDQGKKTGMILMAHVLFTYFMWLIKG
ncbi:EpsG family protein [Bacteroides faecium]|nr:EpsG family protein [Bacteroides faecium]